MRASGLPVIGGVFRFVVLADFSGCSKNILRSDCIADMKERFDWDDEKVSFVENRILGQMYKRNWEKRDENGYLSQDEINRESIVHNLNEVCNREALEKMQINDVEEFAREIEVYKNNIGAANRARIAENLGGPLPLSLF